MQRRGPEDSPHASYFPSDAPGRRPAPGADRDRLVLTTFAAQFAKFTDLVPHAITHLFDSNSKMNFPTAYKILALLSCTVLLALIATVKRRQGDRYTRHWKGLAFVFLFLTTDEATMIHQNLDRALQRVTGADGALYFSWTLVYLPLVAAFVVAYWRFFRSLRPRQQLLFVLAGACYAGGSGGLELLKSATYSGAGYEVTLQFGLLAALSDSLQEIGLLVFLYALLVELADHVEERVRLQAQPASSWGDSDEGHLQRALSGGGAVADSSGAPGQAQAGEDATPSRGRPSLACPRSFCNRARAGASKRAASVHPPRGSLQGVGLGPSP